MLFEILVALTTGVLGIFLGAQIAEGALFVPHWKTLPAQEFFDMHKTYGKKIYQFFAPLTIIATMIPLATASYGLFINVPAQLPIILMGVATMIFFSTYFLFFKKANNQFAEESIAHEDLPVALEKWGNWHWGRVVFEFVAFVCSIVVLMQL